MSSSGKKVFSTQLPDELVTAVRATVAGLQRIQGPNVTLTSFVTDALAAAVDHAQLVHNDGQPFPRTDTQLTPGARIRIVSDHQN